MLPVQLTGFVGRENELAALRRLLPLSRLLTLTGAGGSGKTRLALAAVSEIVERDGIEVLWVELASLSDASSLTAHLSLALGVRAEGGASAERALVAALRDRTLLLVLDNCEHVVEECARVVDLLLQGCDALRVLATSREALGVAGERSWLVPALSLPPGDEVPTPADAMASEAVRLFVERAQDVVPSFTLTATQVAPVIQICRRLDGLPLAIELAAARANVLTPQQIAERLGDRFSLLVSGHRTTLPRHRTLRAAVDWSYSMLSETERLLLERLSIFASGFTLDAAEQVCAGGAIPGADVLDLLAALTTRSLVAMQEEQGRARYRLLETIREYAQARRSERLDSTPIEAQHASYFLAQAREAEPELLLGRANRLRQMDIEHDNMIAALEWSHASHEGSRYGLPLCWALMWYWFHRQLWREGYRHFESALAGAVAPPPELRAAALHGLGLYGLYVADPQSRDRLTEADAIWRQVGNRQWLGFTLVVRTIEASLRRDPVDARTHAETAVAVAREVPDPWHAALAVAHAMVPVLLWEEQWARAAALLREAERTYRSVGYDIGTAYVLDARAFTALQLGDTAAATSLARASLRGTPEVENRWLAGRSLRILGAISLQRGDHARAATLYGAADALYEAIGARSLTQERKSVNEGPQQLRVLMSAEAFAAAWDAGRALSLADATLLGLDGPLDDVSDGASGRALNGALDDASDGAESGARSDLAAPSDERRTGELPAPAAATPHLVVRALGPLEILRTGVLLSTDAWSYARPRELLLYLLAHREGRTREQIGLEFWPDVSAAQVKNNFHVTLHHLRKAIGRADVIRYERDRYRVDFDAGVEFDAMQFEELAQRALKRIKAAGDHEAARRELEQARALYRGGFLDEESVGDWHLATRDRLARLYSDAIAALAELHTAAGDHAAAVDAWRSVLDADSLNEPAVRQLMVALVRDGRRADALRQFERFKDELAREMEAEPERDTAMLIDRVRSGSAV